MGPRARPRVRDFRRGIVGEPRASTARDANGTMHSATTHCFERVTQALKSPRDDHAAHARISARKKKKKRKQKETDTRRDFHRNPFLRLLFFLLLSSRRD